MILLPAVLAAGAAAAPPPPSCGGNPKPAGAGCGPLFTPGWGFEQRGGFPPIPWSAGGGGVGSTRLEEAFAAYFVGNASGMDSPSELAKEVRLGYVGIGWQLNNIPSHYSHLETYEILEAQRLKQLRPGVKVGVTRNTEVGTVFWDSANKTMLDPATQEYWTLCGGKPCVGSWVSPAGNTPKYWFNFSNPKLVDWWLNVHIGEAVRNPLFDGIYFDCCCGSPPGDAFLNNPAAVQRFRADAQAAFDRALVMIAAAGKWASSWDSEGAGNDVDPPWKGITQGNCKPMLDSWLEIGSNPSLTLQALAVPFFAPGHNPFKPPGPPTPPPPPTPPTPDCRFTLRHNFCARGPGTPVISSRLHTSTTTCCRLCMADPACKSWTLDATNASVCVCYLQAIVNDPDEGHTAVGCTSGVPPPPSPPLSAQLVARARHSPNAEATPPPATPPPATPAVDEPYFSQNNTIAAFMISRGSSAVLELPVCGAYEAMADYDLSNPLLNADFGAPLGPGKETAPGQYAREYSKATISLDCGSWTSTFVMKGEGDV